MLTWAHTQGLTLRLIEPGKSNQNASIESFNGRFRDECLNAHLFTTLAHAQALIEAWRCEYNEERPKKGLGGLTPALYAQQLAAESKCSHPRTLKPTATQGGGMSRPPPDDLVNPTVDFHGERRRNDTHQSTTDPQARLYRKGSGREAILAYLGHVLLDNRHGLVANVCVGIVKLSQTAVFDAQHGGFTAGSSQYLGGRSTSFSLT